MKDNFNRDAIFQQVMNRKDEKIDTLKPIYNFKAHQ